MAKWVNKTVVIAPRNGTTSHTVTFAAAGAGNYLLMFVTGGVTTTASGWTLIDSAVADWGSYLFSKTATAGEASVTLTHNGSNYPVIVVVYEFPAGTTFQKSSKAGNVDPGTANILTGLTGTPTVITYAARALLSGVSISMTWNAPAGIVTEVNTETPWTTNEGAFLSSGVVDNFASASFTGTGTITGAYTQNQDKFTVALNVAAVAPPAITGTIAVTAADATASIVGTNVDPNTIVGTIAVTAADATGTLVGTVTAPSVVSLWSETLPPDATPEVDNGAVEFGTKMTFAAAGNITGIRFPRTPEAAAVAMTGYVYGPTNTLLGSVTIPTGAGWQVGMLTTPIPVTPGSIYTIGVHKAASPGVSNNYYSVTGGFNTAVANGPITGVATGTSPNGVYKYGSGGTVPDQTFSATNYFTDVLYSIPAPIVGTIGITAGDATANIAGTTSATNDVIGTLNPTLDPAVANIVGAVTLPPYSAISVENALAGESTLNWFTDAGNGFDHGMLGYSTTFSPLAGTTVNFKIHAPSGGTLSIYRLGWYGGAHARLVATTAITALSQPAPQTTPVTNERNCSSWTVNASWAIPGNLTGGLFLAVPRQGANASHIPFVVINQQQLDEADIVVKTSDATWVAYNHFNTVGSPTTGPNLYGSAGDWDTATGRVYAASYDRPLVVAMAGDGRQSRIWNAEMDMLAFLERNGYKIAVVGHQYVEQNPNSLLGRKAVVSSGHDEYWSQGCRNAFVAARDHPTQKSNLVFATANEAFWRIRYESGNYRRLVCYKDSFQTPVVDPVSWTGTFRDSRNPTRQPEEELTGDWFIANGVRNDAIAVPSARKGLPFWRSTSIYQGAGTTTFGTGSLGFEWDYVKGSTGHPTNLIKLSSATVNIDGGAANDNGEIYTQNGTFEHTLCIYKAASGALVFSSGTNQWSWLLGNFHANDGRGGSIASLIAQQATINLLADMGAQPNTLMVGAVAASNQSAAYPWPESTPTAVFVGTTALVAAYLGTDTVNAMYLGTTKVL